MWLNKTEGFDRISALAREGVAFLFVVSYDKSMIFAQPLCELDEKILYSFEKKSTKTSQNSLKPFRFSHAPLDFYAYQKTLQKVQEEIRFGNTYLLNLTFATPIETNLTLEEIFIHAKAPYKLLFKEHFVCFSPELFVEITDNTIATYPMKGTIDATLPDANATILSDPKETAEHIMIVDLMRNDLAMIGTNVAVEKFRYVDQINAGKKSLLQVSSKITATLPDDWREDLGDILCKILPAGSISGTPKKRTVEIIDQCEDYDRGFYTGVFGIFDGKNLSSSVMIRFIEQNKGKLYYKSGGGITIDSNPKDEYNELIDKIYLPF